MSTNNASPKHNQKKLAWFIILLCALFLFFKYLMQVFPSAMNNELMQTFQLDGTKLGIIGGAFFISYLIIQLFSGLLLDFFSIRLVCCSALLFATIGLVLFAHTQSINIAITCRIIMGAGAAFATVSYMKLTANWFEPRQFATISGFVTTAAMLGAIFGDAPLAYVSAHYGWRQAIMVCAYVGIALTILFFLFVKDKPRNKIIAKEPANLNNLRQLISKPQNWILLFYTGLAFSPVSIFAGLWGNPFLQVSYQMSHTQATHATTLIFIGLAIGGPIIGYISDKLNSRKTVMIVSAIISLVSISLIIYTHLSTTLLNINLFAFGLFSAAFMLAFTIAKESNSISMAATVVALINTGDPIICFWAEPAIGRILDLYASGYTSHHRPIFTSHGFHVAFSILIANVVLALILTLFIKRNNTNVT